MVSSGGIYHLFTLQPVPNARLASVSLRLLKDFSCMLKIHHSFTRDLLCAILYFKYWEYKDEKDMTPVLSHVTYTKGNRYGNQLFQHVRRTMEVWMLVCRTAGSRSNSPWDNLWRWCLELKGWIEVSLWQTVPGRQYDKCYAIWGWKEMVCAGNS